MNLDHESIYNKSFQNIKKHKKLEYKNFKNINVQSNHLRIVFVIENRLKKTTRYILISTFNNYIEIWEIFFITLFKIVFFYLNLFFLISY